MLNSFSATDAFLACSEQLPTYVDGHLSRSHGVLPRRLHTIPLPTEHSAWQQAAEELPALAFNPRAQAILDQLPCLPADADNLSDTHLKWSATLLGILAHAYWRFGLDNFFQPRNSSVPDHLPEAITSPWRDVCCRLGRPHCGLTFEDFTLNNFTFSDADLVTADGDYNVDDVKIEKLRPLAPAYGSQAERVFVCSFAEMHAQLHSLIAGLPRLERALAHAADAPDELTAELEGATHSVRRATHVLRKISPNPRSKTYCDPVEWGKTIASFTVPATGYPVGPSGSAAPIVHLLDALIGRTAYESDQGKFAADLRASQLPAAHRIFFDLIVGLRLRQRLTELGSALGHRAADPIEAYHGLVDAFAGPLGFLGAHKAKVINYLGVSTLVGRNQSTAHQQTYIEERSWTTMADQLHQSMNERPTAC
jgi:hypothetical protein